YLLLRRVLRSALFPYTTLFRSIIGHEDIENHALEQLFVVGPNDGRMAVLPYGGRQVGVCFGARFSFVAPDQGQSADERHAALGPDRKSTRLNSSHVKISYAVFC